MTYSLSNNCTENYYNRTLTVQVIVEDVVTWIFLRHSVCVKPFLMVVWCSSNASVSINAVALHWARLVLGWVTAFGQVNCLTTHVTSYPGQFSLTIPPWVGAMSTGDGYGHH